VNLTALRLILITLVHIEAIIYCAMVQIEITNQLSIYQFSKPIKLVLIEVMTCDEQ
jgi:hypothetical protein